LIPNWEAANLGESVFAAAIRLSLTKRPNNSLVDFFKDSPLRDMDIDMMRSKGPAREIDL